MKKFIIKRPTSANPNMMEWKTYQKEGTTWVGPIEYATRAEAEAAAAEWSPATVIVEVEVPNQ
jgi:hypothetical protein